MKTNFKWLAGMTLIVAMVAAMFMFGAMSVSASEVVITASQTDLVILNLTTEQVTGIAVASYNVDGKKWVEIKGEKGFNTHVLPKLLNKGFKKLEVSDKPLDKTNENKADRKLPVGKALNVYTFNAEISKRTKFGGTTKYGVYYATDTDIWMLTVRKTPNKYATDTDIQVSQEITKTTKGDPRVWSFNYNTEGGDFNNVIEFGKQTSGKVGKYVYEVREIAKELSPDKYQPASKVMRIKVLEHGKLPFKEDKLSDIVGKMKNDTLKIKKNMEVRGVENLTNATDTTENTLVIGTQLGSAKAIKFTNDTNRDITGSITLRVVSNGKKPASAPVTFKDITVEAKTETTTTAP